jgi:hypothetical protein
MARSYSYSLNGVTVTANPVSGGGLYDLSIGNAIIGQVRQYKYQWWVSFYPNTEVRADRISANTENSQRTLKAAMLDVAEGYAKAKVEAENAAYEREYTYTKPTLYNRFSQYREHVLLDDGYGFDITFDYVRIGDEECLWVTNLDGYDPVASIKLLPNGDYRLEFHAEGDKPMVWDTRSEEDAKAKLENLIIGQGALRLRDAY